MIDKTIRTEVKVQPDLLVITISLPLDFDDLVDLVAYEERERTVEKCKGLNRNYINTAIATALSKNGVGALKIAQDGVEEPDIVPDHVFDFVERELGYLYPELKDHPLRLQELADESDESGQTQSNPTD